MLENVFSYIVADSRRVEQNSEDAIAPVGMLTTTGRDEWAANYARLMYAGPKNKANLVCDDSVSAGDTHYLGEIVCGLASRLS